MAMMMKVFKTEAQAKAYVTEQGGKMVVHYEWDAMRQTIIKTYIVKF